MASSVVAATTGAKLDLSDRCRSGGIIFERDSVGSLVYPPGGAIDEKFCHATGCNTHQLIEQPHRQTFPAFGLHQVCSFESELLIKHHKWTHLVFILTKCRLIGARRSCQFSGQHIGANERETRALT